MLDLVDEAFDEMALLVKLLVVRDRLASVYFGWDDRLGAESEVRPDPVDVVCLVGNDVLGHKAVDQCFGLRAVVDLAGREDEAQRIAEGIDGDVDFRGRATARAADRLSLGPPFPPAECWCARTIVASMMTLSISGSSLTRSRMRDHTPFFPQREKRRKTEFHSPNSAGRSPRDTRSPDPEDPFHELAIVLSMTARIALFPRNKRRNPLPLCICQARPLDHPRLPSSEASLDFAILNHERRRKGIGSGPPDQSAAPCKPAASGFNCSECPQDLGSVIYDQLRRFLKWTGPALALLLLVLAAAHPLVRGWLGRAKTVGLGPLSVAVGDVVALKQGVRERFDEVDAAIVATYKDALLDDATETADRSRPAVDDRAERPYT